MLQNIKGTIKTKQTNTSSNTSSNTSNVPPNVSPNVSTNVSTNVQSNVQSNALPNTQAIPSDISYNKKNTANSKAHLLPQVNDIVDDNINNELKQVVNKKQVVKTQKYVVKVPEGANDAIQQLYNNINVITMSGFEIVAPKFEDMGLNDKLLKAIYEMGWNMPSPIQQYGILPFLQGRDILCKSHTGTGKTGTYLIPIINNINITNKFCQAMVLTPSRELSLQIFNDACKLAMYTEITIAAHIGGNTKRILDSRGVNYSHNVKPIQNAELTLYKYPIYQEHIIIGTPGRCGDLINTQTIDGSNMSSIVLDEADKMLNQSNRAGFINDILTILNANKKNTHAQLALYSATINNEIIQISDNFLTNPVKILVPQENTIAENSIQYTAVINNENEKSNIINTIFKTANVGQVIIFCNRKQKIDSIAEIIKNLDIPYGQIHSDMTQQEREASLLLFRNKNIKIMIATEIIARGIDTHVDLVINFDIPIKIEDYVHRIGRTGRYGKFGTIINIVDKEEFQKLSKIASVYQTTLEPFSTYIKNK